MKKNFLKVASLALTFNILFASCQKEDEKAAQPEEITVEDNASVQNESDDVVSVSDDFMAINSSNMRVSGESATGPCGAPAEITKNSDGSGGKIVIDFGTGKTCPGGRTRKGKIIIDYTGKPLEEGHRRVITFDNYYVNDTKIEGTQTVVLSKKEGTSIENLKLTHLIKAEGIKLKFKDGKTAEWNSERTRIYDLKGTWDPADDEITVTGTATGTNRNSVQYAVNVTTPIMLKASCSEKSGWVPVSGVLTVTPADDKKERIVHYGDGTCDRVVTIMVGSISREMTIK